MQELRGTTTIRERSRFSNQGGQTARASAHTAQLNLPVVGQVDTKLAVGGVAALLVVLFLATRGGGGSGESAGLAIRDLS